MAVLSLVLCQMSEHFHLQNGGISPPTENSQPSYPTQFSLCGENIPIAINKCTKFYPWVQDLPGLSCRIEFNSE